MSERKYLAADFGAESGRVILGLFDGKKITLQEMHRFANPQTTRGNHIHWDASQLFDELKTGLARAATAGHKDVASIGVDTWGVDFGLLGHDGKLLEEPVVYRDSRTDGMLDEAFKRMPREEIYAKTGIQFMQLNTAYQLLSLAVNRPNLLTQSKQLLFIPDLFNYFMTGEKVSEYSIASTSQLLNAKAKRWETSILERFDIPSKIMAEIIQPGAKIGRLLPAIAAEMGLSEADVVAPGCHDTASAVAAVPTESAHWAYLSSGTWSLLGVELDEPVMNAKSLRNNFTNEGGVGNKIRFLRNLMGLWLLQRCKKDWESKNENHSYEELVHLAEQAASFKAIVNPDAPVFLNPPDMPRAIEGFCRSTGQSVPRTKGEFTRAVLESLALKYRFVIEMINGMLPNPVEVLHIVGGGSQNALLNQFTANATGLPVVAGPVEATALGNIMLQAIANGEIADLRQGREIVKSSVQPKTFLPQNQTHWTESYGRVKHLLQDN